MYSAIILCMSSAVILCIYVFCNYLMYLCLLQSSYVSMSSAVILCIYVFCSYLMYLCLLQLSYASMSSAVILCIYVFCNNLIWFCDAILHGLTVWSQLYIFRVGSVSPKGKECLSRSNTVENWSKYSNHEENFMSWRNYLDGCNDVSDKSGSSSIKSLRSSDANICQ